MEMERMMGCQIPAFGVWNYCTDHLPITQYFDLAMQRSCLKAKRAAATSGGGGGGAEKRRDLEPFGAWPPASPRKPPAGPQIKVIRRDAWKQSNGGELQEEEEGGSYNRMMMMKMKMKGVVAVRAVDEDLYKVPQQLLYQKPKKMRKVVWSLWIGCLGLDCIA